MLAHALRGVLDARIADELVVVVPRGDTVLRAVCAAAGRRAAGQEAAGQDEQRITAVDGGSSRADSVRAGIAALSDGVDAILVHDAARALTPAVVFERVAHSLAEGAKAVTPAVSVVDTIKTVASTDARHAHIAPERVTGTANRAQLRAVQTPQGFDAATLRKAHEAAAYFNDQQAAAITDDAMLVETMGTPVYVVPGSVRALKITTPLDLVLAEALLAGQYPHRFLEG